MSTLLNKTRMLNKILQKSGAEPVVFDDICKLLSDVLESNVYVISRKGKVLGYNLFGDFECEVIKDTVIKIMKFPKDYNSKLLTIHETHPNLVDEGKCILQDNYQCNYKNKISTIVPIVGNRERLGTILLSRFDREFNDDDIVLAEYSATIVGLEILRSRADEIEEAARKKAVVQLALATLSFSELEAVEHIFNELDGKEGLLVASKIADKVGITRSVIVNALRKFESAGVIESRSLGMKGTHIRILNDRLMDELNKKR